MHPSVAPSRWTRPLVEPTEAWLTVPEAARLARTCPKAIYTACAQGALRHSRVGGKKAIRIRPAWVHAWLEASSRGPGD
jgi:excisionase family DNA binding protein